MTATSYIDSLVSVLHGAPDRTVLRSAGTGTTGAELLAAIYRYARVLDAQGVGPGDLVALLAPNRPEALAVRYATHLIGRPRCICPFPRPPRPGPACWPSSTRGWLWSSPTR